MTNIFLKLFKANTRLYLKQYNSFVGKNHTKSFKLKDMEDIKRKSKSPPGVVTLHVLGSGADGAPASVYLFTDQSRYLFNCGEGTQRLAHEYKTKLSRLEHIFFTDKCWSKIGGLPGLALTAQDAGVTQLTLHGPPQLNTLFQAMNRFVVLKKINIETNSFSANDFFEDEVMTVRVFKILSNTAQQKDILATGTSNVIFLYVCKLKPKPGALDLKKCVEKGVPPGPKLGLLKAGIDITLNDGTVVKSSEVSEPTTENQTLIFVDIPNMDYLYSLNNEFTQYDNVAIVIHFSSEKIVSSGLYQLFLSKFGKSTQHMFLNTSNSFSGYIAAHRIQIQLNQLHQGIFPLLGETEKNEETNTHKRTRFTWNPDLDKDSTSELSTFQIISRIRSMTSFRLRPYTGLDRAMELRYTPDEYLKETHDLEGFTNALCDLKLMFMRKRVQQNKIFPKIIFLGTGSCIPNKTRNVSAILVQLNEEAFILLDCGEGTLGQIIRFFGPLRWQNVIKKLKAIYISHLHADHHIGLIGVLKERKRLLGKEEQPLFLFAPKQILPWLNYYIEMIEPLDHCYVFIPNGDMVNTPYKSTSLTNIGIKNISTCLVKHCPHSFGVAIVLNTPDDTSEPLKLTYSGDTMPCPDLINLGYNSTVLIHEATMEDELSEEAAIKMHCTISQALDVAQKMNAKYTVLTHFSQRYAKLPRFPHKLLSNIAIAFDFMQVSIEDLQDFSLLYPAMKLMFLEHYEEMERKTEMRLKKLERKRK